MKRLLILSLVLLVAVGSSSLTPAVFAQDGTPSVVGMVAVVNVHSANVRQGPDTAYPVVDVVLNSARLPIIGVSDDGMWYQVIDSNGEPAWIASWLTDLSRFESNEQLVPAETTFLITVDTHPGFFTRTEDLLTIFLGGNSATVRQDFEMLMLALFMNPNISPVNVRPWLGNEVTIANLQCLSATMSDFLMQDQLLETPRPSVVILAEIKNMPLAEAFLNNVLNTGAFGAIGHEETTYNGYTYYTLRDTNESGSNAMLPVVSMGIIDDFMVFAQGAESYEAIIDVANGAPSLVGDPGFTRVYGELDPSAYVNVFVAPGLFCPVHDPILYESLVSETFTSGQIDIGGLDASDPAGLQDQIITLLDNSFEGYGVSFREENDQLTLDVVSGVDLDQLREITGLSEAELQQVMATSGMELFGFLTPTMLEVLTFGNVTDSYNQLSSMSASTPEAMFESSTGLSGDVLDWLEGSVTMGFIDYPVFDPAAPTGAYFLMVVEPSDQAKIPASIDQLVAAAQVQKDASVENSTVNGVPVTTIRSGPDVLQIAAVDGYILMVTGDNIALVIERGSQATGMFSPDWRALAGVTVAENDATPNSFVAALDLGRALAGGDTLIQAAAIVTPVPGLDDPSQITIICSICRRGDICWPGD